MVSKAVLFASADGHESRALLPVANKPLLLHALDELADTGIDDVTVMASPGLADEVEELIAESDAPPLNGRVVAGDCGFAAGLAQVERFIAAEPFVVHLGDSLAHGGLAEAIDAPDLDGNDALALVEDRGSGVAPLSAGLANLRAAGIYAFGPGVLELVRRGDAADDLDREIATSTERLVAAGGRVEVRAVHDRWRYRERPDTLLQANRFCLSALKGGPADAWLENAELQGPVAVHPTARLTSATIRGPVVIGADVEVRDAYIGPYSSIGEGAIIENSEVENSIILPGAVIRHLGGRLEASIVGRRARIFRDFRLPRAVRVNVGEGAEVAIT